MPNNLPLSVKYLVEERDVAWKCIYPRKGCKENFFSFADARFSKFCLDDVVSDN